MLSQITRRDLLIYLVAIKSLLARIEFGHVVQIDDNSLTSEDLALLRHHLPTSRCIPIGQVDTGSCPRGGTWERLCKILDLSEEAYVVQVDADTVACAAVPEVVECILENRSFTLGTRQGQRFVSAREAAQFASAIPGHHTQLVAERALSRLSMADDVRYVRGSSGFAGFARGGFPRRRLEEFSVEMQRQLGDRWREWGTEQVSSSFAVANSHASRILPYPKYACYDLEMDPDRAALLHFIGTNRFDRNVYAAKSCAVISQLLRA